MSIWRRQLSGMLPQVLAAPAARPPGASNKRHGGADEYDGDEGDGDGCTWEGAFVPLQRTGGAAWWAPGGCLHPD